MTAHTEANVEYRQLLGFYAELVAFIKTHTIDDIDRMVMDGTFGASWPKIDENAPPEALPRWSELKPADPSRVQWLGRAERTLDEDKKVTDSGSSSQVEDLLKYLRELATIPEALARQLAEFLTDLTVSDGRIVAGHAHVAALGSTTSTHFQIPLGPYFHEVLRLSDPVVQLWKNSTLSIQLRPVGVRLMLRSPPCGWALAVSLDRGSPIVLDDSTSHATFECGTVEFDGHKMAIVPFGPRP